MVTSRGNSQSPFKPKKKVTSASMPATATPANFTQRPMSYQTPQLQSNLTPPMTPQVPQISTNQGTQSGYTQAS